jgi:hypothetical protein
MAALIGKDGSINIGANVIGYIDSWQLNPTVGTAEITSYGDSAGAHAYVIKDWTATASGTLDKTNAQQITLTNQVESAAAAVVALRFVTTTGAGSYWGGNAYVKTAAIASQVGSKVNVNFSFQGSGNLTYTSS